MRQSKTRGWAAAAVLALAILPGEAAAQPELVCPPGSTPPSPAPAGREAAFGVNDDGSAEWLGDAGTLPTDATDNRVVFEVGSPGSTAPTVLVRVEVFPQSSRTAAVPVACGPVAVGSKVAVVLPAHARRARHLLRVAIYRELAGAERDRFTRLSRQAREALTTDAFTGEMVRAQLARTLTAPPTASLVEVRADIAARRYREAHADLGQLANTLTTLATDLSGQPYGGALRRGHTRAATWARSAQDALAPLLALCPTALDAECLESNEAVTAAAHQSAKALAIRWVDELEAAARGGEDQLLLMRACSRAARLRWLSDADSLRLVAVHELPVTTRPVLQAPYDRGRHRDHHMTEPYTGGIMMVGVPTAQTELAFSQAAGEELATNFSVAALRFFRLATGVLAREAPHTSSVCYHVDPNHPDAPPQVEAVDDVPAFAAIGTRSWVLNDPAGDHITEVSVCAGASCSTGASSNVRDEIHLRPRHGIEWAALLEAGFTALPVRLTPSSDLAYTRATYRAAGGNQGPEQLFVLENEVRTASLFTLSALFGFTFPIAGPRTRGLVAAGVVLFDLEGRRAFQEYVLRFGIPLFWENVYLTVGAGVGWMPIRVDPGQAEAIVVNRPMGAGSVPATPSVALADEVVFTLSVGLSVDMAIFGEAVDAVIKALGGG